jgi:hypothetical protein
MKTLSNEDQDAIVRQVIENIVSTPEAQDSFRGYFRAVLVGEIEKAIGSISLSKYTENLLRDEIKKHVLSKFQVDIRVNLVEPPNGVGRCVISPDDLDPIGEERQA